METMNTEALLTEAEHTLYHVSCVLPLVYTADIDKYAAEITEILQSLETLSEQTREKITNALLMMHRDEILGRSQPDKGK